MGTDSGVQETECCHVPAAFCGLFDFVFKVGRGKNCTFLSSPGGVFCVLYWLISVVLSQFNANFSEQYVYAFVCGMDYIDAAFF